MTALEKIKDMIDFCDAIGCHRALYESLKAVEAELEALQPRSCEGCKYDFIPNFILNNIGDKIDICYMCSRQERLDRHKPKEQ